MPTRLQGAQWQSTRILGSPFECVQDDTEIIYQLITATVSCLFVSSEIIISIDSAASS